MKRKPMTNADVDKAIAEFHDELVCFHRGCRSRRFAARAKNHGVILHCGPGCELRNYLHALQVASTKNINVSALLFHGKPESELPDFCGQSPMFSTTECPKLRRVGTYQELQDLVAEFMPGFKLDALDAYICGGKVPCHR